MTDGPLSLNAGFQLQDYCIERVLGVGDTTITYYAMDTRRNQPVAVKEYCPGTLATRLPSGELHPRSTEVALRFKQGRDRFRRTARIAGQIRHPGLARIEGSFGANNTFYLVATYVAGSTLFDLLEHEPCLGSEQTYRLFTDILPALAEVHARGALHNNVTPASIVLRGDGRWVLTGMASASANVPDSYAAPELREEAAVDPRTDLYAFGITAYRCVSGLDEERLAQITPRTSGGLELEPATSAGKGRFPAKLLQAIDRAINPDPAARPASARSLLASVAVAKRKRQRARVPLPRVGVLATVAAVVVAAVALGMWQYERMLTQATQLTVQSNVAEAEVFLDGTPVGAVGPSAPLSLTGVVPGTHRLQVRRTGYQPHAQTLVVAKGQRHDVNVLLSPAMTQVAIEANVTDYTFFVGGESVAPSAPNVYRLPVGEHRIRVEKPGFLAHEQSLAVRNDRQTLRIQLQPECREIARVEQACTEQPLQRFGEQLVTQTKSMRRRGFGRLRVLENPLYQNSTPTELQDSACLNAQRSVESNLLQQCEREPRDGEFFLSELRFERCDCEAQHVRDVYGRRALAAVQCRVLGRATCATEITRAVRYTDINRQCEDVLVKETICN